MVERNQTTSLRWPLRVTTLYFTTYFELLSTHFKLCTTHSKFFETHFEFTAISEIFATQFEIFPTRFEIFASSQHIRPRTPSVGREKGMVTQLLLLPSTPSFVRRGDNNYKKVLFFCRKCRLELAANVAQRSCDIDSQKHIIETYFLADFEYETIVSFLAEKFHGIHNSLLILKRRLRDYYVAYTSPQIWPFYSQKYSAKSVEGTGPRLPRKHLTTLLFLYALHAPVLQCPLHLKGSILGLIQ